MVSKQIHVVALFQTGVYIIDSPGFGENSAMDKMLMDYISANQIFAFIYVIKSDNAGGVQEDRVSQNFYPRSFFRINSKLRRKFHHILQ